MKEHKENLISDIQGTVIDIETIGNFNRAFGNDSRRYKDITQVILGYIDSSQLHIYCADNHSEISELKRITQDILKNLETPFHAFNCEFETCVFFHDIGIRIEFSRELNKRKYEKKSDAVRELDIPNYDDPFFDNGLLCMRAWNNGEMERAIAHNSACLLKERDILIKRGYRTPDNIYLIE